MRVGYDVCACWKGSHLSFRIPCTRRILVDATFGETNMITGAPTRIIWSLIIVFALPFGTSSHSGDAQQDEWRVLFDGETLEGWRAFKDSVPPEGWQVVDGNLTRVGGGGDIVSVEQFGNFELRLEWNISEGGNSGIMFRVDPNVNRTFESGPEMQVLDDAKHPDGRSPLTSAGANYGLHASPSGHVRPPGDWNEVRIIANGAHVEYWLNGMKVVEYELWSPEWEELIKKSKFVEWPEYGRAMRGHIVLQDHGDWVAYRKIRIKEY